MLLLVGFCLLYVSPVFAEDRDISFQTEDGWTIHGTLSIPDGAKQKIPVVILLPSVAHDRASFGIYRDPGPGRPQYAGLAPVIRSRGVATLSLDLRGRGRSMGRKEQHSFNDDERAKIYLDVRAAMSFLEKQSLIDASRIGLVGAESSADAAVLGWSGDSRVQAMALVSGRLSEAAKQQIAASPKLPLFLTVSSEDKHGFADMTDAYFLSNSKTADIEIYDGLGIGTWMFSMYRQKFPKEQPLHEKIGNWVADQLLATGWLSEVSFQTEDGWTIYGNYRMPERGAEKKPAVILLHSGLSDRHAYHELEVALAKAGLAVLNIDWRGKGKSTGKGQYFELSRAERDKGHLDAMAAVNYLASQPGVDASRIGILGTVIGARYAMAALAEDARIKTGVVLTGYIATDKEKTYLTSQKIPVLYVTSRGHSRVTQALTELYNLTKDNGSELLTYDGGAIGYQLFKLDDQLLPHVVRWMKEKLQ
jgi:dienelactone hydrolase